MATGQRAKPRTWRNRWRGNFEIGRYCSLRTTVRGRRSTQDIALFLYHDVAANLSGSGLVVVSFETGGELAEQFADAWFEKTDASLRKGLPTGRTTEQEPQECHFRGSGVGRFEFAPMRTYHREIGIVWHPRLVSVRPQAGLVLAGLKRIEARKH